MLGCRRFKMAPGESWANVGAAEHALRFRKQTHCGHPDSDTTSGLVAYLDREPVGVDLAHSAIRPTHKSATASART